MFKKTPSQYNGTYDPRNNSGWNLPSSPNYNEPKSQMHHRRKSSIFSNNDRPPISKEMHQMIGGAFAEKDFSYKNPVVNRIPQREFYQNIREEQSYMYDRNPPPQYQNFQNGNYREYDSNYDQMEQNRSKFNEYCGQPSRSQNYPATNLPEFYQENRNYNEPPFSLSRGPEELYTQDYSQFKSPIDVSKAIGRNSMFEYNRSANNKSSVFFNDKVKRNTDSYENNENIRAYLKVLDERMKKDALEKGLDKITAIDSGISENIKSHCKPVASSPSLKKKQTTANEINTNDNNRLELSAKKKPIINNETESENVRTDEKRSKSESGRKKVYKIKRDKLKNDGRSENVDESFCDKIPDINTSSSMRSPLAKMNVNPQGEAKAHKKDSLNEKLKNIVEKPPMKSGRQQIPNKTKNKGGKTQKIWGDEKRRQTQDEKSNFGDISSCLSLNRPSPFKGSLKTLSRENSSKNLIFSPIVMKIDDSNLVNSLHQISIIPTSPPANFIPNHHRAASLCITNKPMNDFVCISCGKSLPIGSVSDHPKDCLGRSSNMDENNFFTFKKQRMTESPCYAGKVPFEKPRETNQTPPKKKLLDEYNKFEVAAIEKSDHCTSRWEIDKEIRALANKLRESVCSQMETNKENEKSIHLDSYVNDIIKASELLLGTSNQPLTLENLSKITELIEKINLISKKAGEQAHALSKNLGNLVNSKAIMLKQEQSTRLEKDNSTSLLNTEKSRSPNNSLINSGNCENQGKSKLKVRKISECAGEKSLGELHVIKTDKEASDLAKKFENS